MSSADLLVPGTSSFPGDGYLDSSKQPGDKTFFREKYLRDAISLLGDECLAGDTSPSGGRAVLGDSSLRGDRRLLGDSSSLGDTHLRGDASLLGERRWQGDSPLPGDRHLREDSSAVGEKRLGEVSFLVSKCFLAIIGLLLPPPLPPSWLGDHLFLGEVSLEADRSMAKDIGGLVTDSLSAGAKCSVEVKAGLWRLKKLWHTAMSLLSADHLLSSPEEEEEEACWPSPAFGVLEAASGAADGAVSAPSSWEDGEPPEECGRRVPCLPSGSLSAGSSWLSSSSSSSSSSLSSSSSDSSRSENWCSSMGSDPSRPSESWKRSSLVPAGKHETESVKHTFRIYFCAKSAHKTHVQDIFFC